MGNKGREKSKYFYMFSRADAVLIDPNRFPIEAK